MKKYVIWLLLITLGIGGLGTYLGWQGKDYLQSPLQREMPLNYLSKAMSDDDQNLYLISNSQQKVLKVNREGVLQYIVEHQDKELEKRFLYTDFAVDSQQRLYVLNTELDRYGLYVMAEEIVRYNSDGRMDKVIHRIDYDEQSKMLRIGNVKSMQVKDDVLHFFVENKHEMKLFTWDELSGQIDASLTLQLPKDRYLSQIVGFDPGAIYFSTKRGSIYQVIDSQTANLVYPLDTEHTRRNFPYSLNIDEKLRVIYVDQYTNGIGMLDAKNDYKPEIILSQADVESKLADVEDWELINIHVNKDDSLDLLFSDGVLRLASDGEVITLLEQADYSDAMMMVRWFHWFLLVVIAVLLVLFVRIVYTQVMKRRISLMIKHLALFVPLIVISMMFLSNFIYQSYTERLGEEMMRELVLLARNGKNNIDGDQIERFTSPENFMNEDYQAVKKSMNFIFEDQDHTDRRGIYSTLYKYEDDRFYVIADDDDGVNMFKPYALTDDNRLVIETGKVGTGAWEDETGAWMYAIAPVYNSSGKIVGVYETGRDMNVLQQSNASIYSSVVKIIVVITLILLLIFVLTTYYLLSSIRKLRDSVTDMANGNWHSEVHIRTSDEVAELGERFNYMAGHIRKYIANLTNFSEASSRFVPQQFLQYLGKYNILDINLGDQVQSEMVVMVSNIRSFYNMSNRLSPKEIFNFMNGFLRQFGPIVRNNDGLISKYLGAGFMSLFPNDPGSALKAAIEIRKELVAYNRQREKLGNEQVDIGVAIHKGPLMLGIIGEEKRMEGSVISDAVNTATILERMTETLGVSILITEQALHAIENHQQFKYRCLGRVTTEGGDQAVVLYDVFEGDDQMTRAYKEQTKALFEQGISLYQEGRFHDAREAFVEVIKQDRFDKAAKLYFYLCDEYFQHGTSTDWNGSLAVS